MYKTYEGKTVLTLGPTLKMRYCNINLKKYLESQLNIYSTNSRRGNTPQQKLILDESVAVAAERLIA